ncbi:hypothetical protein ACGFIK_10995 [Micromonospora sp. NPDC048871]|nr:hypothetical protein OIE53_23030 [Micromonospora sp. NBC_01739]
MLFHRLAAPATSRAGRHGGPTASRAGRRGVPERRRGTVGRYGCCSAATR